MKAYRPSEKLKQDDDTDVDVTPIMNLVVVLIPLLLQMAAFTKISLLEYLPPLEAPETAANAEGGSGDGAGAKEAKLGLIVNLTRSSEDATANGLQVSMYGKTEEGPHFYIIPLQPDGSFNMGALTDSLWSIKQNEVGEPTGKDSSQGPNDKWAVFDKYKMTDAREVSLTADGTIIFQDIVSTMDACRYIDINGPNGTQERKELFPNTLLKQFQ